MITGTMVTQKIEQILTEVFKMLPGEGQFIKQDMKNSLREALTATLAKMELVTREEFDIQTALLQRTRAKLDKLEKTLSSLEKHLTEQKNNP